MKNKELFEALSLLEKERGIPVDFMLDKIKKAIITACNSKFFCVKPLWKTYPIPAEKFL